MFGSNAYTLSFKQTSSLNASLEISAAMDEVAENSDRMITDPAPSDFREAVDGSVSFPSRPQNYVFGM